MKLIGHNAILKYLETASAGGRLSHAYLFFGPDRVGKMSVALWLAGKLLGTENPRSHADFSLVERATDEKTGVQKHDISIEQVRGLRERLSQSSFFPTPKVAIIERSERLSLPAANALLKTLEEPPGKAVIILTAVSARELPATILSRVQIVRFAPVSVGDMTAAGIPAIAAELSGGAPGLALELAEDTESATEEMTNFLAMLQQKPHERVAKIESWFGKKKAHAESLELFEKRIRFWKQALRSAMLAEHGAPALVRMPEMGENMPVRGAFRLLRSLERVEERMRANANVRYLIDEFFLT